VYAGGCTGITSIAVKPGVFGPAPMLWIHGDEDDYTYAGDRQEYAQLIRAAGTPTEFVLLPGARHKFDAGNLRRIQLPNVIKTRKGCPPDFDVDALTFRDRRNGAAIPLADVGSFSKTHCAATGASVEGDRRARDTAAKAVDAFLKQVFKLQRLPRRPSSARSRWSIGARWRAALPCRRAGSVCARSPFTPPLRERAPGRAKAHTGMRSIPRFAPPWQHQAEHRFHRATADHRGNPHPPRKAVHARPRAPAVAAV
jgi:hypothetical protein